MPKGEVIHSDIINIVVNKSVIYDFGLSFPEVEINLGNLGHL